MAKRQPEHLAKKGGNSGKILIIVAAVVIVALVVVIVLLLTGRNAAPQETETPEQRRNVVVNEENVEDVLAAMMEDDFVAPGNYDVTMNTTWYFRDGTSVSENAYVENDIANTNDVYFDVALADTEEIIYSSPLLPIGSHISTIALDKDLDAGTYPCVIIYTLVDEDQAPLSTLRMTMTVVVEN